MISDKYSKQPKATLKDEYVKAKVSILEGDSKNVVETITKKEYSVPVEELPSGFNK